MTTAKESGHGVSFFSIPLTLTSYSSTVIPVILAVWFMSYVERFAIKISSKAVKFFLMPMITTLITAIVTLLILGPGTLASNVAQGGVGSFFLGILGVRNFAGASPGPLTIAAYIGEDTLKYFYTAIAGLVISVVISFIVTFVLYKED